MQIATIEDKFIFLKEILDIELKTDINEVDQHFLYFLFLYVTVIFNRFGIGGWPIQKHTPVLNFLNLKNLIRDTLLTYINI